MGVGVGVGVGAGVVVVEFSVVGGVVKGGRTTESSAAGAATELPGVSVGGGALTASAAGAGSVVRTTVSVTSVTVSAVEDSAAVFAAATFLGDPELGAEVNGGVGVTSGLLVAGGGSISKWKLASRKVSKN